MLRVLADLFSDVFHVFFSRVHLFALERRIVSTPHSSETLIDMVVKFLLAKDLLDEHMTSWPDHDNVPNNEIDLGMITKISMLTESLANGKKKCLFVSHRWLSKDHPDPEGVQLQAVRNYLSVCVQDVEDWVVFYDYSSLRQNPQTPAQVEQRRRELESMTHIILKSQVLVLQTADYYERAWCFSESILHGESDLPLVVMGEEASVQQTKAADDLRIVFSNWAWANNEDTTFNTLSSHGNSGYMLY